MIIILTIIIIPVIILIVYYSKLTRELYANYIYTIKHNNVECPFKYLKILGNYKVDYNIWSKVLNEYVKDKRIEHIYLLIGNLVLLESFFALILIVLILVPFLIVFIF